MSAVSVIMKSKIQKEKMTMQMIPQSTVLWAVAIEHVNREGQAFDTSTGRVIGWTPDEVDSTTVVPLIVWFDGPAVWSAGNAVTPDEGLRVHHVVAYGESPETAGTRARRLAQGLHARWVQEASAGRG